jgi:hypothetical protein
MSDRKYCEDCRWFVDGHGYYMPYARCSNPIAVEQHAKVNLVHKTTHMAACMEARDADGACGVEARLFELRQAITPEQASSLLRAWRHLIGSRR